MINNKKQKAEKRMSFLDAAWLVNENHGHYSNDLVSEYMGVSKDYVSRLRKRHLKVFNEKPKS